MEWLPPGWASSFSESRKRLYYYQTSNPQQTQWTAPSWDDVVEAAYAQHQVAEPALKPFRSLRNYMKNCILYYYIFSNPIIKSILDVGCGKGGDVHKVPPSYTYLGIDICSQSLAEAQRRHPDKQFLKCSMGSISKIDATFDSAMCMFALHYGGDSFLQTLTNIRSKLGVGGIFVFVVLDEAKIGLYPQGYGPLQILKTETRPRVRYRASRRIHICMAGVAQSTPEYVLDKDLIYETAPAAKFEVVEHISTLGCVKQIGVGEYLDPSSAVFQTRAFCERMLETCYAADRRTWDGVVWSFADMYKVVVLKAL